MKVAVAQMASKPLDPEGNLEKVLIWIKRAAAMQAKLIVFPECAITGYVLKSGEIETNAEPIPGRRTEQLHKACRESGIVAAVGTIERDEDGVCFNTAVLVGANGILGTYRKTHLPGFGLDRVVKPGSRLGDPIPTSVGRCGMVICYDLYLPEPVRIVALAGAQLVLVPAAWSRAATYYPDHIVRTRSAENGIYLLVADHAGREGDIEYLGRSIITGPDGQVLAESRNNDEEILVAEIDPRVSDHKERIFEPGVDEIDLFADRRPELYSLVAGRAVEMA